MDSPSASTYKKLTVSLLRDELGNRGLDSNGKKPELIERLEEHDKLIGKPDLKNAYIFNAELP